MNPSTNFSVRVRFAPAPTGHLHIGSFRTTLFNWLFAKHHKGAFLLRVEDTDRERSTQAYTDSILEALQWVGIVPDEPLVIQSSRAEEHIRIARLLVSQGKAYHCYCSQEEVTARYLSCGGAEEHVKYDGLCRNKNTVKKNNPFVIRFKIPETVKDIEFIDMIRGSIVVPRDQLDDFILVRSDGSPMYNFVVVIDDVFMRISHIIRGEEHIINTPKQILLYRALEEQVPTFAHIPLVLGPSGQKLSKREAATAVIEYKKAGFLPDALVNYLARLGWSHGNQERFTKEELISYFDCAQVSKSGAIFDIEKLLWLNSVYLREKNPRELVALMIDEYGSFVQENDDVVIALTELYKERVHTLKELFDAVQETIRGPGEYHERELQPLKILEIVACLKRLENKLIAVQEWTVEAITSSIKHYAKENNIKIGDIMHPLRVALIGKSAGPGVFTLFEILGKKESLHRVMRLYNTIERMFESGL